MAFERNLYIDQWGRLKPKHSQFTEDSCESSDWGHTCECCGAGCTPELLKNAEAGTGVWRFEINPSLERNFDIRQKRFRWLRKKFPGLMRRLEKGNVNEDEIHWFYDPKQKREYGWWWDRVVENYKGLR